MINDVTLGIIAAAVPLLIIGFLALRRLPAIFAFYVALLAVGIGYLTTTGAVKEFGHKVRVTLPAGLLPEHKAKKEAEEPAKPVEEAPAMAPAAPQPAAPEPAPAPAPAEAPPASPPAPAPAPTTNP